jgi:hypothetical protein
VHEIAREQRSRFSQSEHGYRRHPLGVHPSPSGCPGVTDDGRFPGRREVRAMTRLRALAFALTVAAVLAARTPARADILTLAQLAKLVNATPPLHAASRDDRMWVSLARGGDAVGYLDPTLLDYGYTIDKQDVLIVPLTSGGSGGVFTTVLFTHLSTTPVFAGKIDSDGHLDVHLAFGMIEARTPVYGPHDPQAAPSGHKTVRYRLRGTTLVKVDEFAS